MRPSEIVIRLSQTDLEPIQTNEVQFEKLMNKLSIVVGEWNASSSLEKSFEIILKNRENQNENIIGKLQIDSGYLASGNIVRLSVDLREETARSFSTYRDYEFTLDKKKDTRAHGKVMTATSSLYVDKSLRGMGTGSLLLSKGEEIKLSIAKVLAQKFGFNTLRSIIEDHTDPVGWSGQKAIELGYSEIKPIKTYKDSEGDRTYPTYERFDTLSLQTTPPSMRM